MILRDLGTRGRLDRAQDRRFEGRIVLLEIHRDLRVADLPSNRPDEECPDQSGEPERGDQAEGDDRADAEPQRLEARCRQEQRQERPGDDQHDAAHGQPLPPAVPHRADDFEEFGATIHGLSPLQRPEAGGLAS